MAKKTSKSNRHRPTLKQQNKKHKNTSMGARLQKKGRVNTINAKTSLNTLTKSQLDQRQKSLRDYKVNQLKLQEKLFKNGYRGPVIPLTDVNDSFKLVEAMFQSCHNDFTSKLEPGKQSYTLTEPTSKVRLQFIPMTRDFVNCLDICKVADNVIFLISVNQQVDSKGETLLSSLQAQGIPNSFTIAQDIDKFGTTDPVKKSLTSFMAYFFPENSKILTHQVDELNKTMRTIASSPTKNLNWREGRPYMYADNYEFRPTDESNGTLVVRGYLRGANVNPNRLVHLHDLGDFQLSQVSAAPLPTSTEARVLYNSSNGKPFEMFANLEEQDNLNPFNSGEENMDLDEDFSDDDNRQQMNLIDDDDNGMEVDQPSGSKQFNRPTSSYQQAWLPSDEEDELDEEDQFDSPFQYKQGSNADMDQIEDGIEHPESDNGEDADLANLDHDTEAYQHYLQERQKQLLDHKQFPDEIDTPIDVPARQRFIKYRGLEYPRSTYWDPYEELPADYSKLHHFKNFKRMQQHILEQNMLDNSELVWNASEGDLGEEECLELQKHRVRLGTYCDIHIQNVPNSFLELYINRPLTLFFLLPLENKVTVLNSLVNRYTEFKEPVQSKDPLMFQIGFRRFKVNPIFSQHARKTKAANNVYKYTKFLVHHEPSIATFYGPITFGQANVIVFQAPSNSNSSLNSTTNLVPPPSVPNLVAYGQFKDCDVTRIIAKRIILTGHPLRINRRSAVIRYMFFNDLDVIHFKPVQLQTKFGLLGHIADSIGTHGLMKCRFNGQLKQHDTITLKLYKRVFSKSFAELALKNEL